MNLNNLSTFSETFIESSIRELPQIICFDYLPKYIWEMIIHEDAFQMGFAFHYGGWLHTYYSVGGHMIRLEIYKVNNLYKFGLYNQIANSRDGYVLSDDIQTELNIFYTTKNRIETLEELINDEENDR